MKEMSKQICFVCGKSYKTKEIPSIKIKVGKKGVWEKATIKKMVIQGTEIPLCQNCLKAALLSATLINSLAQSSPVCFDFENYTGEDEDEAEYEEPEINPCRGCEDYDNKGGCLSNGGCGERRKADE